MQKNLDPRSQLCLPARAVGLMLAVWLAGAVSGRAQVPQIVRLNSPQLWQRLEFRIANVPSVSNPFDPDIIRLDASFQLPSGRLVTVPAFWYQAYQRSLSGSSEQLSLSGSPEWRLRFAPPEPGDYSVVLTIRTNGQLSGSPVTSTFSVPVGSAPTNSGYARVAASRQYLETGDGQPLRLIGENVCWPGSRGTYDYDDWFGAMPAAGENYARLWMCPWAFGLETDANSLTRYRLDHAWQLDYVFQLAETRRIWLLVALDFHGMFEVTPDYWGGNNYWPSNPYNVTNGGPCLNQNGFFTNTTARTVYQKRLRYLVARYGYSPSLAVWQFFNEIDNEYAYLNASDVATWHGVMGNWLHTNDPFGHLVTTSLTGNSDRSEIWSLPQMDVAAYHSYNEPGPAGRLATVTQSFLQRYNKPVLVDEFGTDWRGWNRATTDPYLRGFRQGIWGGALGGSVGTAMSWYWESIHAENDYPVYTALGRILRRTGWGQGSWTNIAFSTSGSPPATVGNAITGGVPFMVTLTPNSAWGGKPSGLLAVPNPGASGYAASTLNCFFHGTAHPELRVPFRLSAWLTNNARIVMHLNSVSSGATLAVRADGVELWRTNLPNLDGGWQVNNEYNQDLSVNLPSGKRLIEVINLGLDWFYLDWVRLEQVQPATYNGNWQPSPDSIGLRGPRESLLYVVAPGVSFPAAATNVSLPLLSGQTVTLTNWPRGSFFAEWYDPATAARVGYSQGTATNGSLTLPLPDFKEDLAGIVYPPPVLRTAGLDPAGAFQFALDSETSGQYILERSSDLLNWSPWFLFTNSPGTTVLSDPGAPVNARNFLRVRQNR